MSDYQHIDALLDYQMKVIVRLRSALADAVRQHGRLLDEKFRAAAMEMPTSRLIVKQDGGAS